MKKRLEVLGRVVIAGGSERRSRALAGLQLLDNGDLLVGYRYAGNHPVGDHEKVDDGAVLTVRSTDNGHTWGEPHPVAAIPGWDCAGGNRMVQTPGGDLLMFVMQARRANRPYPESHVYPTRSTDHGRTRGPLGTEMALFSGWTEPHATGRMLVLKDGRWMVSVYGADARDALTYTAIAFSDDEGRTWGDLSVIARDRDIAFYEAAVARLADGRFLAAIRNTNYYEMGLLHPKVAPFHSPPYRDGYSDTIDAIDKDGCVDVPDGPGLGVEYDWEFITRNAPAASSSSRPADVQVLAPGSG